jgi:hypothetical protein
MLLKNSAFASMEISRGRPHFCKRGDILNPWAEQEKMGLLPIKKIE